MLINQSIPVFYSLSDLIIETHITSNDAFSINLQRPVYLLGTVTLYLQSYLPVFTSSETLAEIIFASWKCSFHIKICQRLLERSIAVHSEDETSGASSPGSIDLHFMAAMWTSWSILCFIPWCSLFGGLKCKCLY